MKISKVGVLSIVYFFVLFIFALLPKGLSDYNGYVLLFMASVYLWLVRNVDVYRVSFLFSLVVFTFSLFQSPNFLFVVLDCAFIFYVIGSVYIGCCFPVKEREIRFIRLACVFICLLSVLGIFNPIMYAGDEGDEFRYLGIFHGITSSACIFSMVSIVIWELEKKEKRRLGILVSLIVSFLIYMWAAGTRSLLFILPYWLYQLYTQRKTRIMVFVALGISLLYLSLFSEQILEKFRLDENEASLNTRSSLYLQIGMGILDNYVVIPHGSYTATAVIRQFTGDSSYSPHNDILKFIYEWGILFFVFCIFLMVKIKKHVRLDLEFVLILVALISCSLHNMLSTVYLWIPFLFILIARRRIDKNVYMKTKS